MEDCNLPTGTAKEPEEEAHLSQGTDVSSPNMNKQKKGITFAEATQSTENSTSQNSSTYKDVLSQPAGGLTHRQRLLWLQKRRSPGLWAQCDDCDRWRYLPHVLDAHELPDKWSCSMNPDKSAASCSVPEVPIRLHDEEDLIHAEYSAGSVVWAKMSGWPWWPAMVDDEPDTEQYYWLDGFSDIPTHYNVVFFDAFDVTRAWIAPENLVSFGSNKSFNKMSKDKRYRKRLEVAVKQAEDANKMAPNKRLAKYSFIARYPGCINHPKKINKNELIKFQNKLKRKYNIEFPNESGTSDDDECVEIVGEDKTTVIKKGKSMLLVGTPKRSEAKKNCVRKESSETKITKKKIQAYLEIEEEPQDSAKETPSELNKDSAGTNFKEPSSMAVQVSNTVTSTVVDGSIDNDTSATFVPESENENDTLREVEENILRVPSPRSDDFDF